jgi:rod shape-determining protein MreB
MKLLDNDSIGIDLGTSNVRVYVKGKGIVLNEPAIVAVNRNTGDLIAIGDEANQMLGRAPANIVVVRPLRGGVISSYHDTQRMLSAYLRRVIGRRLFSKPTVMVCVPSGVTDVEKRALIEVTEEAGARRASLIEEPIAAAIGAGLDIAAPYGSMVVDIGGGTTDVAVISLGGLVVHQSIKVAGDVMDEAIAKYIRRKYDILIGERTAGEIKVNIGSAFPRQEQALIEIAGRNVVSGLPKRIRLSSNETIDALTEPLSEILEVIHNVLERTPPELASDVAESGICLTGGGALLFGIEKLISAKTGLPCYVADDAIACVAIGTGKAAENMLPLPDERIYE